MAKEPKTDAPSSEPNAGARPPETPETPVESAPEAPKKTPREWGMALGHYTAPDSRRPQIEETFSLQHAAANALYRWHGPDSHEHHYQGAANRFEITQADYEKALETAMQGPLTAPHAPAIPVSQQERLATFQTSAASAQETSR